MVASRRQWEALARVWDLCEYGGLQSEHLGRIRNLMAPPALVVGAGQGLLVNALGNSGVNPVLGLDHSPAMCRLGRRRRHCSCVVGESLRLPFHDSKFRTLVCATGVIDPGDETGCRRAYEEFARVTGRDGIVVIGLYQPSEALRRAGASVGVFQDHSRRNDRLIKLWRWSKDPVRAARAVAEWTGCSLDEAGERIRGSAGYLRNWHRLFGDLACRLNRLQYDPASYLESCFAWTLPGVSPASPGPAWDASQLEFVRSFRFEESSVLMTVFRVLADSVHRSSTVSRRQLGDAGLRETVRKDFPGCQLSGPA